MRVITRTRRGQAGRSPSGSAGACARPPSGCRAVALAGLLLAALPALVGETHRALQAVTAEGTSAWDGAFPILLRGVLLCDPDEMLDARPGFLPWAGGANASRMGGEWQVVFQAVDREDRGGTTCWLGQNYGNLPWLRDEALSYPNEAWAAEVLRLSFDPATLHRFRAGDLIEVTAQRSLFYGGKRNLNEAHDRDPAADFQVRLLVAGYGLPEPEVLTLADVMRPGGTAADPASWQPVFDPTRATGGEHWQGMRVRVNGLSLVTREGWNPTNAWSHRRVTATDGQGRFLGLRHPRNSLGPPPTVPFDAWGIFTQESGSGSQGTNGYELFVQQVRPHGPAPELTVGLHVAVAWPDQGEYQLEWRPDADTGVWTAVTHTPAVMNGTRTVLLPPTSPQRFYRLRAPD